MGELAQFKDVHKVQGLRVGFGRWQKFEFEGCVSAFGRWQKFELEGCVSAFGRWQEAESESLRVGMGNAGRRKNPRIARRQ